MFHHLKKLLAMNDRTLNLNSWTLDIELIIYQAWHCVIVGWYTMILHVAVCLCNF